MIRYPVNEEQFQPSVARISAEIGAESWVIVNRRSKNTRKFHGSTGSEKQILHREFDEAERLAHLRPTEGFD